MEGWVDLGSLIAAQPEIEPTTAWSQVRRPNRYATKPPFIAFQLSNTQSHALTVQIWTQPNPHKIWKKVHPIQPANSVVTDVTQALW